ncbi:hypothetical protein [Paenibacillus abyssi]|uniref:Uncharacterized protein n=1 Tax=Paenibacillus abyssi TaxID=1340531 RepID=A0A917D920_9BACL|nr:hypothetical protein [Paenibacillus abyssi]GGG13542.1 hypothetical protein GCM10010916_33060 [Paenibacillus abyssi]
MNYWNQIDKRTLGIFFVIFLLAYSTLVPFAADGDKVYLPDSPIISAVHEGQFETITRQHGGQKFISSGFYQYAILMLQFVLLYVISAKHLNNSIALRLKHLMLDPVKFTSNYVVFFFRSIS